MEQTSKQILREEAGLDEIPTKKEIIQDLLEGKEEENGEDTSKEEN
jgi:hypothetical protein